MSLILKDLTYITYIRVTIDSGRKKNVHPQDSEGASFRCLTYTIIHPSKTNIDIMYNISAISRGTTRKLDTPNPIRPPTDDQRFLELS